MENEELFPMNNAAGDAASDVASDVAEAADPFAANSTAQSGAFTDPYAADTTDRSGSFNDSYAANNAYQGTAPNSGNVVNSTNSVDDPDKIFKVLAYITLVGWIIALVARNDKENPGTKQHLNQAIVCWVLTLIPAVWVLLDLVLTILSIIPIIGWVILIFSILMWILVFVGCFAGVALSVWGLIRAVTGNDAPMPIIGKIRIIK